MIKNTVQNTKAPTRKNMIKRVDFPISRQYKVQRRPWNERKCFRDVCDAITVCQIALGVKTDAFYTAASDL